MIPDLGALDAWRRLGGGSGSKTGGAASRVASESLMSPTLLGATLLVGMAIEARHGVLCSTHRVLPSLAQVLGSQAPSGATGAIGVLAVEWCVIFVVAHLLAYVAVACWSGGGAAFALPSERRSELDAEVRYEGHGDPSEGAGEGEL